MSRFGSRLRGTQPVGQWLRGTNVVKSVQRGTITLTDAGTSATATITAVVLANARLRWLGQTNNDSTSLPTQALARLAFTNATTITANTLANQNAGKLQVVSFEVIEYWPGVLKSVQRGTITTGTPTATITAVDVNKSELDYLGNTDSGGGIALSGLTRLALTNATTVTFSTGAGNTQVTGYQVVEFY